MKHKKKWWQIYPYGDFIHQLMACICLFQIPKAWGFAQAVNGIGGSFCTISAGHWLLGLSQLLGNVLATLGRAPQMAANWDTNNPRKMKDREFHWVKQAHLVISEETWVTLYVLLASRIFAAGFFHWWLVLHCHLVDYRRGFGRIQGMTMTRGFMGCKTSNSG